MTVERGLRLIAGLFVMWSVFVAMAGYPSALWFTIFVGANLFQSALTNWCPMMPILRRAGCQTPPLRGKASQPPTMAA